jgi:hypothetical protein
MISENKKTTANRQVHDSEEAVKACSAHVNSPPADEFTS